MSINELKKKFIGIYGGSIESVRIFQAAGRVNLIGEHIDYNGGRVFPAALSLRCLVAARKTDGNLIRLAATTLPDRVSLDINKLDGYRNLEWGEYQAGVAYVLQKHGYSIQACELLYDCDVPFGSGLSSSAAIEVATAITLATFSKETGNKKEVDLVNLAVMSQEAENTYAGVNCGIMDQFASALGKKNNAILLNCANLEYEYIPLELGDYKLVIANSKKPRSLQESKYNERRAECDEALRIVKQKLPQIKNLCEVTVNQFEEYKTLMPDIIRKRCEHAVYESRRVEDSVTALKSGDIAAFGKLLNKSHVSLKDLYEVTGRELDSLAEAAQNTDGCIGSRMTGAGFGGCTVSIVHKDKVDAFIKNVSKRYTADTGYTAEFYIADIEDGAKEI